MLTAKSFQMDAECAIVSNDSIVAWLHLEGVSIEALLDKKLQLWILFLVFLKNPSNPKLNVYTKKTVITIIF